MYQQATRRGFTLIELLIVVLIIGILATIALPQYQLALEQARVRSGIVFMDAWIQAEEIYYLNHGNYTTDWNELDIKIPLPKDWIVQTSYIRTTDPLHPDSRLQMYINNPQRGLSYFVRSKELYYWIHHQVPENSFVYKIGRSFSSEQTKMFGAYPAYLIKK